VPRRALEGWRKCSQPRLFPRMASRALPPRGLCKLGVAGSSPARSITGTAAFMPLPARCDAPAIRGVARCG